MDVIQIDPSKRLPPAHSSAVVQFPTRRKAAEAAKSVGWAANDATEVDIMGFRIWTITDQHDRAITRDGFARMLSEREGR